MNYDDLEKAAIDVLVKAFKEDTVSSTVPMHVVQTALSTLAFLHNKAITSPVGDKK